MEAHELDHEIRAELRALPKQLADRVARHLVAAGRVLTDDPAEALAHATAARRLASRVGAVREAVGLAAYHAGEWQSAIAELRTYQRISGRLTHLAVVADCERALGRPERAIDLHRTAQRDQLAAAEAVELLIVAAGARRDLGQAEAAVAMLQVPELSAEEPGPGAARLRYAYADALLELGRQEEAREWFGRAAVVDEETDTDAAERLLELEGVVLAEEPDQLAPEPGGSPVTAEEREFAAETEATDEFETTDDAGFADDAEFADPPEIVEQPEAAVERVASDLPEAEDPDVPADRDAAAGAPSVAAVLASPPAAVLPDRLLDAYDLVILDLDGVVYVGEEPVPGAVDAIGRLRQDEIPVVYATNNASRSAEEVADLLSRLGVNATAAEVLTSSAVAAEELARRLPPGAAVLVVGSEALAEEVRRVGLRPVRSADQRPDAVVQGYGPQVGWAELAEAYLAVRAGAIWVATNTDATLPSPRGPLPGNGALVAALRTSLRRDPDAVVGKPQPELFAAAARRAGAGKPLVVGDRLDTDIEGAHNAGMDSLLVLTGVDGAAQAQAADPAARPTYVGADLAALFVPGEPVPAEAPTAA